MAPRNEKLDVCISMADQSIGMLSAHFVLGFLPEQKKLEQRIPWYDAKEGVEWTSMLQILGGFGSLYLEHGALQALLLGGALEAMLLRYGSAVAPSMEPLGTCYLEVRHRVLKGAYSIAKRISGTVGNTDPHSV